MNTPFSLPRINMDSFRVNLRRGPPDNAVDDLERQQPEVIETPRQEMAERTPNGSFLPRFAGFRRPTIPSFLSRSSTGTTNRLHRHSQPMPRPTSSYYSDDEVDSPKTPLFNLGMPTMPSTRLHLPHLTRTWTQGSSGPPSRPGTSRGERFPVVTEPVPAVPAEHVRVRGHGHSESRTRFDGADPAELHLASLADDGRRRRRNRSGSDDRTRDPERRHRRRHRHRHRERDHRPPPKHFLFCFPWIKSRRIRSQILRCFVSGLFLTLLLSVCKFNTGIPCHVPPFSLVQYILTLYRPWPLAHKEHQQQRVFGAVDSHHPLHHHLLLPRPDPAVHPDRAAATGRGAEEPAAANVWPRRVCDAATAYPGDAGARRGGSRARERGHQVPAASLWTLARERGMHPRKPL